MKKFLLVISALVAMSLSANAQWFIGGSVYLNGELKTNRNIEDEHSNSIGFGFSPTIGYQVNDNLAFGLMLASSGNKYTIGSDFYKTINTNANMNLGLFGRYSFLKLGDFKIYGMGELLINANGNKSITDDEVDFDKSYFGPAFDATLGAIYDINEHFFIDVQCFNVKYSLDNGYSGVFFNLSLGAGIYYRF